MAMSPSGRPRLAKDIKNLYMSRIGLACRTLLLRKNSALWRSSPLKIDLTCTVPHAAAWAEILRD